MSSSVGHSEPTVNGLERYEPVRVPSVSPRPRVLAGLGVLPRFSLAGDAFGIDAINHAAPGKNQDRYLTTPGFAAVGDGATSLSGLPNTDIGRFCERALQELERRKHLPAAAMFSEAIAATNREQFEGRPCCTIALVRDHQGLEVNVLADSRAVIETTDGVFSLTDDRIAPWDNASDAAILLAMNNGASFAEARQSIREHIRRQQEGSNKPGSYWTFAGEEAAGNEVLSHTFNPASVRRVLLMTDGFDRLWSKFGVAANPGALLAMASLVGVTSLTMRLRALERADPQGVSHPRTSIHDDCTAVLLERVA